MAGQILAGIRVLELGQLIAGPFAAKTLADFGAQVVKIEPPGQGDPCASGACCTRARPCGGKPSRATSNRCAWTCASPRGQDIVRLLAREADVLIENFRPGTLEKWGLSWEALHALNPRLIMLRVSGYGQPAQRRASQLRRHRRGDGRPALPERRAGRAPVRAGLSLGDTIAGLHGALGVLLALYQRDARGGQGQVIDAALYESLFNLSESLLPEYSVFGAVREPAGAALPGIAPSNAIPAGTATCSLPATATRAIYVRLMARMAATTWAGIRTWRTTTAAPAASPRSTAPSATGPARVPSTRCWPPCESRRAIGPHLFRGRHRPRPALSRPRAITTVRAASGIAVDMPAVFPFLSDNPGAVRERARPRWANTPTPCWPRPA